jgi:hypothetical protein
MLNVKLLRALGLIPRQAPSILFLKIIYNSYFWYNLGQHNL